MSGRLGRRRLAGNGAWIVICLGIVLAAGARYSGDPDAEVAEGFAREWQPAAQDAILLRLERSPALEKLNGLRARLDRDPGDAAAASGYATLALQHYAETGDARFLGYAEGALRHWTGDADPPASVWLVRGRILQTQHRFRAAAVELERMLAAHPGSLEAMLLAADAWRRGGALDKARSRCAGLAVAGRVDLARFCAADLLLSMGDAENALRAALGALTGADEAKPAVAQWALGLTADAAAAAGRVGLAESAYRQALALPGAGIALHVAHADLLLRDDRPRDVLQALAGLPETDAVLLRKAIAAKALRRADFDVYRSRLLESFAEARALGGGELHLREQATFELHVEGDAAAALSLARENWAMQKGPEDAAILVQAAEAAGSPEGAQAVAAWRRQYARHGS